MGRITNDDRCLIRVDEQRKNGDQTPNKDRVIVLTQCQRVTDRQTDRRTDGRIYYS